MSKKSNMYVPPRRCELTFPFANDATIREVLPDRFDKRDGVELRGYSTVADTLPAPPVVCHSCGQSDCDGECSARVEDDEHLDPNVQFAGFDTEPAAVEDPDSSQNELDGQLKF